MPSSDSLADRLASASPLDQLKLFAQTEAPGMIAEDLRRMREKKILDEQNDSIPSFLPPDMVEASTPRISFFRHGESTGNAGESTSDPATIPLTPLGHGQAEQIARWWSEAPTLVVVSPYCRTRQTAVPLLIKFPLVPVTEWPVQEFTYLSPSRCVATTGAERRPMVEKYWSDDGASDCDGSGAESFSDLLRRVGETRTRLEALPAGSRVAVFTHGQFLQALRLLIHFPSLTDTAMKSGFRALDRKFPIENGARLDGVIMRGRLCLLERLWW